ncbi:MAG TPA: hypothetical protein VNA89_13580 [Gemmatimonadaceae bacterium]|nr:hypothetical protein [Gemmatimonadaceae bacterium]
MRDDTDGGPRGGPHDDTHTQSYREEQGRLSGDDAPLPDAAARMSLGSTIRGPIGSEVDPQENTEPAPRDAETDTGTEPGTGDGTPRADASAIDARRSGTDPA